MISVIIPTYNRRLELKRTLDSLLSQSLKIGQDFEVVVVDDGSSDGSDQLVKSYGCLSYYLLEDKGFRVSKARNIGAVMSEGENLVFIDSGVICHHDFIKSYKCKFDSDNGTSAFVGKVFGVYNNSEDYCSLLKNIDTAITDDDLDRFKSAGVIDERVSIYNKCGYDIHNYPAPYYLFWSGNIGMRKDVFYKAGLFDESYTDWGGEDVDLGIRLYLGGVSIRLAEDCMVAHIPQLSKDSYNTEIVEIKEKELDEKYNLNCTKYTAIARSCGMDINSYLISKGVTEIA